MAMTNNYGLNYVNKNRVKKLHEQGVPVHEIAKRVRCTPEIASRTIRALQPKVPHIEPDPEPVVAASDEFGPLQGTQDWKLLPPGEKAKITRARNAAA